MIEKKNNLTFLVAKKGSGKSILAEGLLRAQNKPSFWITPIIGAFYPDKIDAINAFAKDSKNTSYFEIIDREEFSDFMAKLFYHIKENLPKGAFIVIDELDYYHDSRINHKSPLYSFINMGRHLQADLLAISRRPQDLPKTLRDNADSLILGSFNSFENIDKLGFISHELCERLATLGKHEFLKVDLASGVASVIKITQENAERIAKNQKYLIS